jgi:hypothetical protein
MKYLYEKMKGGKLTEDQFNKATENIRAYRTYNKSEKEIISTKINFFFKGENNFNLFMKNYPINKTKEEVGKYITNFVTDINKKLAGKIKIKEEFELGEEDVIEYLTLSFKEILQKHESHKK